MGKKKFEVAFATGSRADYGIVRNYINKLNADKNIDFSILATGALLDDNFGRAVEIVKDDGFKIAHECKISLSQKCLGDTVHIMSEVLNDFGYYFQTHRYDLVIILGDRYEIFSVAIAAAMQRIPILHLHGGEITLANYDEFIRHSITKMSTYHITSTEIYRNRVIQLGENPNSVFNLGALGAENCMTIDEDNVPNEIKSLDEDTFTVLFHPETLNHVSPLMQINEVLKAVEKFIDKYKFVFIGANADTSADEITNRVMDFCNEQKNSFFFYNLHPDAYHYLVKNSIALIGNSSSGIIEVPSLNTFTVNIGNRQTGRVISSSIKTVDCIAESIVNAIEFTIEHKNELITDTPYYQNNSAEKYYKKTLDILYNIETNKYKEFYDII